MAVQKIKIAKERIAREAMRKLNPGQLRKVLKDLNVSQLDNFITQAQAERDSR